MVEEDRIPKRRKTRNDIVQKTNKENIKNIKIEMIDIMRKKENIKKKKRSTKRTQDQENENKRGLDQEISTKGTVIINDI